MCVALLLRDSRNLLLLGTARAHANRAHMAIERPDCHQHLVDLLKKNATTSLPPVRLRAASYIARDRDDKPFYFGWLPSELTNKILSASHFIDVDGGLCLPQSMSTDERKELFCYVDDLLALRLVNVAFSHRYKPMACLHAIRRKMHAQMYRHPQLSYIYSMHCTAVLLCRIAPTVQEQGTLAFAFLKATVVSRMLQEMPRKDMHSTLEEIAYAAPTVIPRFA